MRIFFAIDTDKALSTQAKHIIEQHPFSHMRWSKPENLHLTLRFIGSAAEDQITPLCEEVEKRLSIFQSFTIETDGTICFPKNHPRVFAIYFKLNHQLGQLAKTIHDVTNEMGFPEEKRPLLPHLTLGRFKAKPQEEIKNHLDEKFELAVKNVILYRSEPTDEGSQYSVIHRFDLAQGSTNV